MEDILGLFGYPPEELPTPKFIDLLAPAFHPQLMAMLLRVPACASQLWISHIDRLCTINRDLFEQDMAEFPAPANCGWLFLGRQEDPKRQLKDILGTKGHDVHRIWEHLGNFVGGVPVPHAGTAH